MRMDDEFDSQSNEFVLFVSRGAGGDGREGIERCAGSRINDARPLIIAKPLEYSSILVIPNRIFKQMVDSYSKCKKRRICITFYDNRETGDASGIPGITITVKGIGSNVKGKGPYEKFGNIPDIDPTSIFSEPTAEAATEIVPINEYTFDSGKIATLLRLAALHNEGNVRIYYEPKHPLRMAVRFGSFGECELYVYDKDKYQLASQ